MTMATLSPEFHEWGDGSAAPGLECMNEIRQNKIGAAHVSIGDTLLVVSLTRPSRVLSGKVTGARLYAEAASFDTVQGVIVVDHSLLLDISHAGFADGCSCCYQAILRATRENIVLAKQWLSFDDSELASFYSSELSKLPE